MFCAICYVLCFSFNPLWFLPAPSVLLEGSPGLDSRLSSGHLILFGILNHWMVLTLPLCLHLGPILCVLWLSEMETCWSDPDDNPICKITSELSASGCRLDVVPPSTAFKLYNQVWAQSVHRVPGLSAWQTNCKGPNMQMRDENKLTTTAAALRPAKQIYPITAWK